MNIKTHNKSVGMNRRLTSRVRIFMKGVSSSFSSAILLVIGLCLVAWISVCIRRGKLPTRPGLRGDYFLRWHDVVGFWLGAPVVMVLE